MDTQQKYNEAEYFLGMMKENDENRQRFKYNLSAFVSAARSVTFVLQKERPKNPESDEWYVKKQKWMKEDVRKVLFEFFVEKRNYVLKEGLINPQAEISITVDVPIVVSVSFEAVIRDAEGNLKDYEYSEPPAKPKPAFKPNRKEETKYKWFFKDWQHTDEDVITLCERHLKELKIIVEEAESKFGEVDTLQKQLTDK